MKKILVSSTNLMMRQFLVPHIKHMLENGYQVEIACSHVGGRFEQLEEIFQGEVKIHQVNLCRNPTKPENVKGLKQLKKIIQDGRFDLIWTNEPVMGVMTRLAARPARRRGTKVMYMVHGFHFWKGAPLKNWLVYYPVEWLSARWTDVLITINGEDYDLAKKHMHAKRVEYIPGIGIDTKRFAPDVLTSDEKTALRDALGLKAGEKMLLSVGELSVRKNHEVVIRALAELHDPLIKYYICGEGDLRQKLVGLAEQLGLADSVFLLGYRGDISALCDCADLFVLPSLQEGVSVALMEALASKTPTVCSNIRGNNDIMPERAMFSPHSAQETAERIQEYLLQDRSEEIAKNYEKLQEYDLQRVKPVLMDIIHSL